MHIGLHVISKETDSQWIKFDCPVCQRSAVSARARDLRQTILLFYVIPIFYQRTTLIDCTCGTEFVARLKAKEFAALDAHTAKRFMAVRIPLVLKTLVLGGIVAWLLPLIGTVWMSIAYAWARRYSGWIRTLAWILLLLSFISTGEWVREELLHAGGK